MTASSAIYAALHLGLLQLLCEGGASHFRENSAKGENGRVALGTTDYVT